MGTPLINWYLLADDDGVILVDAGAPSYRSQLEPGLEQLGHSIADVRAVVLTHGDADHKGSPRRCAPSGAPRSTCTAPTRS